MVRKAMGKRSRRQKNGSQQERGARAEITRGRRIVGYAIVSIVSLALGAATVMFATHASWNYLVRARRGYFERERTLGTSFYDATLNYYNCQYALGYDVVRIRYIVSGTWERYDRSERQSMPAVEIQRTRAWKAGK